MYDHPLRARRVSRALGLLVIAGLASVWAALLPTNAQAGVYWWYGSGNQPCFEARGPASPSTTCTNVGANYLSTHTYSTPNGVLSDLRDHRTGSADYCSSSNVESFNASPAASQAALTDFTPPTPYDQFQYANPYGSTCQASGLDWGLGITASPGSNNCSNLVPCVVHRWSVFDQSGDSYRKPWDSASFGNHGSLNIYFHNDLGASNVLGGAYGYVCPVFKHLGTNVNIELCIEPWKIGGGFPSVNGNAQPEDQGVAACQSLNPNNVDQVFTKVGAGGLYSTIQNPSASSIQPASGSSVAERAYWVRISRQDLQWAIGVSNQSCGRGSSANPNEWALVGIEDGIDGGGIQRVGESTHNLWAYTSTDAIFNGETLNGSQAEALTSQNNQYSAVMQPDGNFVIYQAGHGYVWQSSTYGAQNANLTLSGTGNVSISGTSWQTGTTFPTSGIQKGELIMQDDGNLVVYDNGLAYWSLYTGKLRSLHARQQFTRKIRPELMPARAATRWRSGTGRGGVPTWVRHMMRTEAPKR